MSVSCVVRGLVLSADGTAVPGKVQVAIEVEKEEDVDPVGGHRHANEEEGLKTRKHSCGLQEVVGPNCGASNGATNTADNQRTARDGRLAGGAQRTALSW